MKILFVDPKSSTPYDRELMRTQGIGGTESSLVRVAHGLAAHHEVEVAQLGRERAARVDGVRYRPLDDAPEEGAAPDCVVVLRKHRLMPAYRRRYPRARLLVWIHNWQPPEVALKRAWLARTGAEVVAVSEAHRAQAERRINGVAARLLGALTLGPGRVPIHRIYNPIDEDLVPDATPVDPDRMVFLSTANKGLTQAFRAFARLRERLPTMRLLVAGTPLDTLASPPYDELTRQPGVDLLGRLPQREMLRHTRGSLCVFYPQNVHAETFGLIFAEANAVGTPVLAHPFGAACEVLGGEMQTVDAGDIEAVVERIARWRAERPAVAANPEFRAPAVVGEWRRLLEQRG